MQVNAPDRDLFHGGSRCARRYVLRGHVQGIGVRPAIARLADQLGLTGSVANRTDGVVVHVQGSGAAVAEFESALLRSLPAAARVDAIETSEVAPTKDASFVIARCPADGPLATAVPPDRVACDDCLHETTDPQHRRRGYAFTSCTNCGPRYSIIVRMPYERADTTMARFAMCPRCAAEYERPGDRRFHAQTNACPDCGPRVWLEDAHGVLDAPNGAIAAAVEAIRRGRIVALRGLGGYQLICDATNDAAVQRLRERKRRPAKPLAVMVDSLETAERFARLTDAARRALRDTSNAIVLVPARAGTPLAASVHPGIRDVGLFLPTTPLHAALLRALRRPLICTSGNREGEPLVADVSAARHDLKGICDVWLHHDRPIAHAIDDSVVRIVAERPVTLRLARGLAPLPLEDLSRRVSERGCPGPIVALGGQLKSAVGWWNGAQAVLGPHLGELDVLAVRERFEQHLHAMQHLYRFAADRFVRDAHPDYFTSRWAASHGKKPSVVVQHHHAHVVAGMLEHGWLDRRVLGVALDGTGYGPDGTVWGGEFLECTATTFRRVGHLRPFGLPGGEAAIREPWRLAAALTAEAPDVFCDDRWLCRNWHDVDVDRFAQVRRVVRVPAVAPRCSSMGRLFDAVAGIVLGVERVQFEGQAAMLLESVADPGERGSYRFAQRPCRLHRDQDCVELDWQPLLSDILRDHRRGVDPAVIAARFHRAVARCVVDMARRYCALPVVLGGGVFQNRLLTEWVIEASGDALTLGPPGSIPPNDGGLAAGQLVAALSGMEAE